MVFFWLLGAFITLLLEMASPGLFYFFSMTLGAAVAGLAAYVGLGMGLQGALFLGITLTALVLLPKIVNAPLLPSQATNAQALIGKEGIVLEAIGFDTAGLVKIGGQEWMAKSINQSLAVGDRCVVKQIRGCHVVVRFVSSQT